MTTKPLTLKDTRSRIQSVAELSEQQVNNLRSMAQKVHEEMCRCGSWWKDAKVKWGEIPNAEMERALELMRERSQGIFDERTVDVRDVVLKHRLYAVRKNYLAKLARQERATPAESPDGTDDLLQVMQTSRSS